MTNNIPDSDPAPYKLLAELSRFEGKSNPPVHLWQPEQVSEIDIRIDHNGQWHHEGSVIRRVSLARLFSSVLRLEEDGEYYLVTPVEKCRIEVEDVPFQAILLTVSGEEKEQCLCFKSNMGEEVVAGPDHPLTFVEQLSEAEEGAFLPYVEIRDGLKAKISRNVYYQMMDLLTENKTESGDWLGIWSSGMFFPVISQSALD